VALAGGQIARAFTVASQGEEFVLRFNRNGRDAGFEKEAFVARRFRAPGVPIPEVIAFGLRDGLQYCLTRRARGETLRALPPADLRALLPALLTTLEAIHDQDLEGTTGYGLFDGRGRGFRARWKDELTAVGREEREDGFFGKWHRLFDTTFLERELFFSVYRRMEELLPFCPEERRLVHGNFSFGNVLTEAGRITAVVDWLDARFGDPLFDVAGLDFWHPEYGLAALYLARAAERGSEPAGHGQRLLCYQCQIALDGLRFFALANRPESYAWVKDRLAALGTASSGATIERPAVAEIPLPEWSTTAAMAEARAGRLEDWIHRYLAAGYWSNPGLSDGLRLCRRWWRGPLRVPLASLIRVCGPEEGMAFRQKAEEFERDVGRLMRLRDPLMVPPLIVEYRAGSRVVCDGSHRLEAMSRLGWKNCWVVIWYNREADFETDATVLDQTYPERPDEPRIEG